MVPRAAVVPEDEPVASDMKQAIRNMPTVMCWAGITDRPRLTTESTPPEALATSANAPTRKQVMYMMAMFSLEQPLMKEFAFSLKVPLYMMNATMTASSSATEAGT